MFCANCGKEVSEGTRFCPHCGKSIITVSEEKEAEYAGTNLANTETTHGDNLAIAPVQPVLLDGKCTEDDKKAIKFAVIMMAVGLVGLVLYIGIAMLVGYTRHAENEEVFNNEYTYENEYGHYTDNGILEDYDICGTYTGAGSLSGVTINIYTSYDSEYVGNVSGAIGSTENRDMSYSVDGEIKKVTDNVYRLETQYGTVYDFCAYKHDGEILIDVYTNGDVFATLIMQEHYGMP